MSPSSPPSVSRHSAAERSVSVLAAVRQSALGSREECLRPRRRPSVGTRPQRGVSPSSPPPVSRHSATERSVSVLAAARQSALGHREECLRPRRRPSVGTRPQRGVSPSSPPSVSRHSAAERSVSVLTAARQSALGSRKECLRPLRRPSVGTRQQRGVSPSSPPSVSRHSAAERSVSVLSVVRQSAHSAAERSVSVLSAVRQSALGSREECLRPLHRPSVGTRQQRGVSPSSPPSVSRHSAAKRSVSVLAAVRQSALGSREECLRPGCRPSVSTRQQRGVSPSSPPPVARHSTAERSISVLSAVRQSALGSREECLRPACRPSVGTQQQRGVSPSSPPPVSRHSAAERTCLRPGCRPSVGTQQQRGVSPSSPPSVSRHSAAERSVSVLSAVRQSALGSKEECLRPGCRPSVGTQQQRGVSPSSPPPVSRHSAAERSVSVLSAVRQSALRSREECLRPLRRPSVGTRQQRGVSPSSPPSVSRHSAAKRSVSVLAAVRQSALGSRKECLRPLRRPSVGTRQQRGVSPSSPPSVSRHSASREECLRPLRRPSVGTRQQRGVSPSSPPSVSRHSAAERSVSVLSAVRQSALGSKEECLRPLRRPSVGTRQQRGVSPSWLPSVSRRSAAERSISVLSAVRQSALGSKEECLRPPRRPSVGTRQQRGVSPSWLPSVSQHSAAERSVSVLSATRQSAPCHRGECLRPRRRPSVGTQS